jgi:hypothetical protein
VFDVPGLDDAGVGDEEGAGGAVRFGDGAELGEAAGLEKEGDAGAGEVLEFGRRLGEGWWVHQSVIVDAWRGVVLRGRRRQKVKGKRQKLA